MSAAPKRQFRHMLNAIVPPWLSDRGPTTKSTGFKLLFSFGAVLDGLMEYLVQGLIAWFPGLGTPTALPIIGRGRGIRRGLAETDAAYAARLERWRQAHQQKGHPWEILRQIRAYLGPVKCRTVDNSGNWHTIDEDGTESFIHVDGSWNFDGAVHPVPWARIWIVIYAPSTWLEWSTFEELDPTLWGGFLTGGNYTVGQQVGFDVAEDLRELVREWKPQHARVPHIIIAFHPLTFDPANPDTWPTGSWGQWTAGDPAVEIRPETARFWEGVE